MTLHAVAKLPPNVFVSSHFEEFWVASWLVILKNGLSKELRNVLEGALVLWQRNVFINGTFLQATTYFASDYCYSTEDIFHL